MKVGPMEQARFSKRKKAPPRAGLLDVNAFLFTMCERRVHCIRGKYLRAVMRQDMAWFDTQQVGALTTRMSR
ncbi:hypothetical protein ANCDUO_16887 [Ancylostoma duodenale]|uniref:ABC transmembrane type-1 domain-containing protein n=1 Tax=Ancylostoma duodenale TaxID=51022 RepID=A0A0C2FWQ7_9BILA|nr:hypothetical protein ANCDUO_16887 [Ancylostoma duodenale]